MDHRARHVRRVAGVAALLWCGAAAAFVSPAPPPGFGGAPGGWTFTPPTPAEQLGGIMRGTGPSVAGSGPTSAAFRLGAGAARALARASIPGALALGVLWLAQNCFEKQNGQWVRTCGGTTPPQSDGFQYWAVGYSKPKEPVSTLQAACDAYLPYAKAAWPQYADRTWTQERCIYDNSQGVRYELSPSPGFFIAGGIVREAASGCPAGWYVTPAGCVQTPPPQVVTEQEVEDEMATKPLPQTLPPGVPYPLDPTAPSIWNPTPINPPTTQPMRVPMGNPVPIPDTNPQQYRQPVSRVTHSPTTSDPWRMDVQPEDVVSESPTGQTGPETITSGSPPSTPKEEQPDLCEKNPDILACSKLDTPDGEDLKTEDRGGPVTPDSGWGADNASCPQPRVLTVQGHTIPIPYTLFCQYMSGIRYVVLAMAWLSAGFILVGFKGGD